MDYPVLNLLFALALVVTTTVAAGLAVWLAKASRPLPLARLSWLALALSLLAAGVVGYLFVKHMAPASSRQLGLGTLIIGGLGALATAGLYRVPVSSRAARLLLGLQVLSSLLSVVIALGLYRSLVPGAPP